jgi:hypothetical protein
VAAEPLANARTLVSLDDDQRSPLLVERAYERGRVFLWTTSIDGDWNVIPQSPATLIPLVHELLRYGGTGVTSPRETVVGGTLELEFESFPRGVELVRPDGSHVPFDVEGIFVFLKNMPQQFFLGLTRVAATLLELFDRHRTGQRQDKLSDK